MIGDNTEDCLAFCAIFKHSSTVDNDYHLHSHLEGPQGDFERLSVFDGA